MAFTEPTIIINGVPLTDAQAMTLWVALTGFLSDFADPVHCAAMGEIGRLYRERASEILRIMARRGDT